MAFQQPQRPQLQRNIQTVAPLHVQTTKPSELYQLSPQKSREWIIFSPDSPAATESQTVSTARTPRTTGRSRISELGSLETGAGTDTGQDQDDQEEDVDTEDMDSLDDGLHAFHEPPIARVFSRPTERRGDTLLPAHDGLGMFTASSTDVQEQFWQHERYNPRRRRHSLRRSSLQRRSEALGEERSQNTEEERFQRIEKWRMDQSRAILEEIERETRRKRRRERLAASTVLSDTTTIPEEVTGISPQDAAPAAPPSPETESFWTRFTRRVICDLMGLDDATLSLIFGEQVVEENIPVPSASDMLREADRVALNDSQLTRLGDSWQERLLARIAKELGVLVHKLVEHPGAFSTYLRTQDPPIYAGLAVPGPEIQSPSEAQVAPPSAPNPSLSATGVQFTPTLAHPDHALHSTRTEDPSLWGIEEADGPPSPPSAEDAAQLQSERDYWERDLDVKMVFRYFRGRLSPSRRFSHQDQQQLDSTHRAPVTAAAGPRTESDSLRRAALIRRHHPLVSKNVAAAASAIKEQSEHHRRLARGAATTPVAPVLGRRHSGRDESGNSCASQSTKRSKTGRSESSRNYWDVGTGSLGSGGWNAGWGEV